MLQGSIWFVLLLRNKRLLIHALVHFKLACLIQCKCVLYVCMSGLVWICLSDSYCTLHEMPKIGEKQTQSNVLSCVWARVHVCTWDCTCETVCSICTMSMVFSHCSAELSPSPGCSSNWLNLPGKLRGWLEAPSNYITVSKPVVKNRFSCSIMPLFCNKAKICCQKELHSS